MAKQEYCYEYPRPMFTVDAVLLSEREGRLEVLLVQRRNEPFAGAWALPGGFVDMDEPLETAVVRELEEETGLAGVRLEQFRTFGDPDRDPRGRSISTAFLALVDAARFAPEAADDAQDVCWRPVEGANGLAFDHAKIVAGAVERLREYARYAGIGFQALPQRFALERLRRLYEAVEGRPIDPEGFAMRMKLLGVLEPISGQEYRFVPERTAPV
jgi:8-oxo-dGTP diphosphatase